MRKFLSRKFLLVFTVLILYALGIDLPSEVVGLVGAYVIGESWVDGRTIKARRIK